MPDFEIEGNPGNIRSKALTMEQKGQLFYDTGDALSKIDVSGWTGRAADEFREAHDLEPERWYKSGNGFKKAATGLRTYAGELESAQSRAEWAREEHERGQRESESARTQYGSYMDQMRSYWSSGGTDQAQPFNDWGAPIQQDALQELAAARADLENAAHVCAGEVRAGCADAPEEPNWLESGLKFVGGIFEGAGEAIWDLLTMVPFSPVNMVIDSYKLATGDITPEELMKKYELSAENAWDMAQGIYTGLTTDPIGFGRELGKSLLDWDTWADDPARAIGHLVPDALAAVATAGAGALATRGAKGGMDVLDGLSDLSRLDDLADLRHLDDFDDLSSLNRFDGPPGRMFEWDPASGPRSLDDQLRDPSYSPSNRDIVDGDYDVLGGRNSPEEFIDEFRRPTGDPDFPEDWDWANAAPNEGRVPGTERLLDPGDLPEIDRIGGGGGEYFGRDGDAMSQRSLPPDRLNFDRTSWDIDADHPSIQDGSVQIEESEVAPAFGQDGGGLQYRFMEDGEALKQYQLEQRGIIAPMDDLRVHPPAVDAPSPSGFDAGAAAAGAGTTHGLQSLDRFLVDYALPEGSR
ncbi:MAG TPA: TNT domain-containing protein [Nocardioides sp.]|nr:TNT domain-containing protein [Nocardioides sp.]